MAIVNVVIGVDMSVSLSSAIVSSAGIVIEGMHAISLMMLILVRHVIHLRSLSLSQKFRNRSLILKFLTGMTLGGHGLVGSHMQTAQPGGSLTLKVSRALGSSRIPILHFNLHCLLYRIIAGDLLCGTE